MTSPILHIATIPVDGVELTRECEEEKLDDNRKFDFIYGGVYDDAAVRDIRELFQTPEQRWTLPSRCPASRSTVTWEPWDRATPSSSWRTLSGRSGASGRTSLKDMEDQPR
jgi:hypothetical protein